MLHLKAKTMKTKSMLLAALCAISTSAQVFVDDFETGDFSANGSGQGTFEDESILGGERWWRLYNGDESSVIQQNGEVTVTKADNSAFLLRYGPFTGPDDANHLHLSLTDYRLTIELTEISGGPVTVYLDTFSYGSEDNYNPSWRGASITVSEPGLIEFERWDFGTGTGEGSDLTDVAGIEINLASGPGSLGVFTYSEITLTPIPEPSTYAAIFGLGLAGFAVWRRKA